MCCSSSSLGLTETNNDDEILKNLICSVPVTIKAGENITPINLNLSNENQITLTRILKVIQQISLI